MVWSISTAKMFERCQRQWFYGTRVANAKAKHDVRQRAYRLSKLQSVSAWRGSVVDHVLSNEVLPAIGRAKPVSSDLAISSAMARFDRQLAIGRKHRIMDAEVKPASSRDDLTAFHCLEYNGTLGDDEVSRARDEVVKAISEFFKMEDLIKRLRTAERLITQRALCFDHSDVTVRAVPDAIALYRTAPPTIIDWKVHVFGTRDAWLQLAVYAAALTRCNPHRDFPVATDQLAETEIELLEVQLLKGTVRAHELNNEHFGRMDAYIAMSAESMNLAIGTEDEDAAALNPCLFPVTRYPDVCGRCPYRSLCWRPEQ